MSEETIHRSERSHPLYVGWQRLYTIGRMRGETYLWLGVIFVAATVVSTVILSYVLLGSAGRSQVAMLWKLPYYAATNPYKIITYESGGTTYSGTPEDHRAEKFWAGHKTWAKLKLSLCLILGIGVGGYTAWWARRRSEREAATFNKQHIRGPQLRPEEEIAAQLDAEIREKGLQVSIPLSKKVRLPVNDEILNVLLTGAPGSGKTVKLSGVYEAIRDRGCKCILHDFKGDLTSKFFNPKSDLIFNPLDARSIRWNLFSEIKNELDLANVAHSLIPSSGGEGKYWNNGAREVFIGALRYLYINNKCTNADLWAFLSELTTERIKALLIEAGANAATKYIEIPDNAQASGIMSTLMQYTVCLKYMTDPSGLADDPEIFSVRRWLESPQGGTIFISNYADCQDILKPILTLLIDLMARRIQSMSDDYQRRIFFLLDEFPRLNYLSSIESMLTTSRSKGGSSWIGIQDVSQVRQIYGKEIAQTILNTCGTTITFRCPDPDTAEYLSRRIGEHEYNKYDVNFSISPEETGDRQQMTLRKERERLISPAQIQTLPNLSAYVQMHGRDLFRAELQYKSYPAQHPSFVLRDGLDIAAVAAPAAAADFTDEDLDKEEAPLTVGENNTDEAPRASFDE